MNKFKEIGAICSIFHTYISYRKRWRPTG